MPDPPVSTAYQVGAFHFDPVAGELHLGDDVTTLTARAADTLAFLAAHANALVSKDDIMNAVWRGAIVEENNLNQQIAAVRRALSADRLISIETLPRRGYRLVGPVRAIARPSQVAVAIPIDSPGHQGEAAIAAAPPSSAAISSKRRWRLITSAAVAVLAVGAALAWPWYQQRRVGERSRAAMNEGIRQMESGNDEAAVRFYQNAIAIDPSNAQAFASLAHALAKLYDSADLFTRQPGRSPSVEAARRAVELDPSCATCHGSYGFFLFYHDWSWAQAEREFREALRIAPDSEGILPAYAMLLSVTGRSDEALRLVDRALEAKPFVFNWLLIRASALYLSRRYDEALAAADRALSVNSGERAGWDWRSFALFEMGQGEEAVRAMGKVLVAPSGDRLDAALRSGGVTAGLRELLVLTEAEPFRTRYSWRRAAWHMRLGETEPALDELEATIRNRGLNAIYMAADPVYDPIREHPRFLELLKYLNLSDAALPIS